MARSTAAAVDHVKRQPLGWWPGATEQARATRAAGSRTALGL